MGAVHMMQGTRTPESGQVTTRLVVICKNRSNFSEASVSQCMQTYRGSSPAQFQCVHTVHSVCALRTFFI